MDNQALKFRFSQKYNLSESLIDDSLLPVFISNENLEKCIIESIKTNELLADKIKNSIQNIHYENPKTAFYGNLAKYAVPSMIICGVICICYWAWIFKEINSAKYQNLERLSKIIQVQDGVYFVPKENYQLTKKGIILIEKSSDNK